MKNNQTTKSLHPRNPHNTRYDFESLIKSESDLKQYVKLNKYDDLSIDFANPQAVLTLNKSLLSHFYGVKNWNIPKGYLCPPIPGRADYIHYMADLLAKLNAGNIPKGKAIKVLDVGVGANCIYPIIGSSVYDWSFVGSDVEEESLLSVQNIINENKNLKENITTRLQVNSSDIFEGIINSEDRFDFTLCNPPFHKSQKEAIAGNTRKVKNLTKQKDAKSTLNFGGKNNELWCKGGEIAFIKTMIMQSAKFSKNCLYFSTLVSKKENLPEIYRTLKSLKPNEIETIEMTQGQKITRIVVWSFLDEKERKNWFKTKKY
jgi:23S rRNA (adenine1618-N6)-methyltransferase